jgi:pyrroline-5-carboxylate reductase
MIKLGVLGVGDLTEKMLRGLHRANSDLTIVLSPRNRERAERLATEFGYAMLPSNQAVVDASDVVLVGVRPADFEALAGEVTLKPGQPLISVMAGVQVSELRRHFGEREYGRAMLSGAAEINRSTVALFPVESIAVRLLSPLGNAVPFKTEREFELGTVGACINGWLYFLIHELQAWFIDNGMSADSARALVLSSAEDCIAYSQYRASTSIEAIGASIAQPGTYTAQGQDVLNRLAANSAWRGACDRVLVMLTQKHL